MSARPEELPWQQRLRVLFLSAFAVFVIVSCCTGRLPHLPQSVMNYQQDCGSVNVGSNGTIESDPQSAENCLVSAFTHCQAARLTFNSSGIDTGESHQLQVIPNVGECLVKDRVIFSSAVGGLHGPLYIPPVYDCKSIQPFADGLMVKGCDGESAFGERDYVIPLYPAVIGHLCGYVNDMSSDTPDALHCFWQAYTNCQAATLILSTPKIPASPYDSVLQAFISFQRSNGACAVSLVERHIQGDFIPRTCAELINRRNQVVVTSCGTLGDVVLPLTPGSPPL